MTYDKAFDAMVSAKKACAELLAHGFNSFIVNGWIEASDGYALSGKVAQVHADNMVKGSEVFGWLGY